VKTNSARREALSLLVILAIIGLITALIITTYRGNVPSGQDLESTVLGAQAAYPATPDPGARQTAAALFTQNVIEKTQSALIFQNGMYEKTVYLEGTSIPTGTDTGVFTLNTSNRYYFLDPKNSWYGIVDGLSARVDAGALPEDPRQGAIHLNMDLPNNSGIMEQVLTPGKDGAVLVASEFNNRLVLVAEDGTVFYFDLPARSFVSSLTEWGPTSTSTSTNTPAPPPTAYPPPPTRPYPLPTAPPYEPYPTPGG
jgi:hypothetical protein